MPKYRAMVPVLLAFDVVYKNGATPGEIAASARHIIESNLGKIGDEAKTQNFRVKLDSADPRAALYPSDYDWCDTMAHITPDEREIEADPIAWVAQFLADELEQRENGGNDEYVLRARQAVEKFEAVRALLAGEETV